MKFLSNFPLCNLLPSNTLLISNAKISIIFKSTIILGLKFHKKIVFLDIFDFCHLRNENAKHIV